MMHLLFIYALFVKIGVFTFGGGYAMIPLFQAELVTRLHYLTEAEFANLVALAQMTPGPVGLNAATYIGYTEGVKALSSLPGPVSGVIGAAAGTLGVATPSLVLVLLMAVFLKTFRDNAYLKACLNGIRPAVLGLIASAVFFFADTSVFSVPLKNLFTAGSFGLSWQCCVIFCGVLLAELKYKPNVVWTLLGSALAAFLLYLL